MPEVVAPRQSRQELGLGRATVDSKGAGAGPQIGRPASPAGARGGRWRRSPALAPSHPRSVLRVPLLFEEAAERRVGVGPPNFSQ